MEYIENYCDGFFSRETLRLHEAVSTSLLWPPLRHGCVFPDRFGFFNDLNLSENRSGVYHIGFTTLSNKEIDIRNERGGQGVKIMRLGCQEPFWSALHRHTPPVDMDEFGFTDRPYQMVARELIGEGRESAALSEILWEAYHSVEEQPFNPLAVSPHCKGYEELDTGAFRFTF